MHTSAVFAPAEDAHAPNTCQSIVRTSRGDFLVQVAWPLKWNTDRTLPANETAHQEISTMYSTVVVGVGYPMPPAKAIYDFRRGPDLTPPSRNGEYDAPLGSDGKPRTDISFGEADQFLEFIANDVKQYVETILFPHVSLVASGRRALLGHSYGGIFALNALYTKPELWSTVVAASADIEFNKGKLVSEQETDFRAKTLVGPAPSLIITYGDEPQDLIRGPTESEADYQRRVAYAEESGTRDAAKKLVERFDGHPNLKAIAVREFPGEDHGSAAVTGFQHGVVEFLTRGF
ncbi:Alpha/Beta hydrolase protein [Coniella lustricola]|uniref:Alpha/Beta hydrolase protein n=1 Tax=Coniella lustricola TaxID=2025994 RepID=A0A2T2ZZV4_9PEZI|nr:Alpha/Beta hydrolase protein [Coniella lustricola]